MKKVLWLLMVLAALACVAQLLGYDLVIGGWVLSPEELERQHERGYRKSRIVIGGCVIGAGVDPRKLTEVVPVLIVVGGAVASRAVVEAYDTNLRVIGGMTARDASEPAPGEA